MPAHHKALTVDPLLAEALDMLDMRLNGEREEAMAEMAAEEGLSIDDIYAQPAAEPQAIDDGQYEDDRPKPAKARPKPPTDDEKDQKEQLKQVVQGFAAKQAPNCPSDPPPMGVGRALVPVNQQLEAATIDEIDRQKSLKALDWQKKNEAMSKLRSEFIELVAKEADLKRALALSEDPRCAAFLNDLTSPRFRRSRWTVSGLAYKHGLKPHDLATIFRNYKLSQGTLKAIIAIPDVIDDIAKDARSYQEVCPRCDGLKLIDRRRKVDGEEQVEWLDCPNCAGSGAIRKAGSTEARKVLTEMAGYTKQKGPLVQQTFVNVHSVESVVEDLEDFNNAPIIDSTIIDG